MKVFITNHPQILTILYVYNLNLRLTAFDRYILVDFR